jgi:hypothetical protein
LQEKISVNPPPPGATPVPDVSVRIVPAGEVLGAVAELVEPAAAAVVTERTALLADQTSLPVEGVTEYRFQVVATPVYDVTLRLGLQAAGNCTVTMALRVTC